MYPRIAALLLVVCAPLAQADVVELAPDLYLLNRPSRAESVIDLKVAAILEANQFAASKGKVAVPVSGRMMTLGPLLKNYEYQFRLMSRAEALAARPTLADVVISVAGGDRCIAGSSLTAADLVSGLPKLEALRELGILAQNEEEAPVAQPSEPSVEAAPTPAVPPAAPSVE